jgi:hypothetical protein
MFREVAYGNGQEPELCEKPFERMIRTARALCPAEDDILELDARGMPRWLDRGVPRRFVPMRNWRVRRGGSRIHPALRPSARAYRALLRTWITLGGARLTHRVSAPRSGEWQLGDLLLPDMPALSTAAISIGIPGPAQKITAQLMDGRGRILGIAKYADSVYTRTLVENEARMLRNLPENVGPRLVRLTPFLDGELLVQTVLPGRPRVPRPRLDAAQVDLFDRLVQRGDAYAVSAHPFVKSSRERAGQWRDALDELVDSFGDGGWPLAWTHGDMAPWNMHWWRGTCLAFDWEHGREKGFPYLDAAATLIQVSSIIRRAEPQRAKRAVCEGLREALPAEYGRFAPQIASLSALNMILSWYPPRPPDAYQGWLKAFIEAR